MPFGKRPATTTGYRSIVRVEPRDAEPFAAAPLPVTPMLDDDAWSDAALEGDQRTEKPTAQRLIDLSETMLDFLARTIAVAEAVRTGDTLELPGLDIELQPEALPIDIRILEDYFTFSQNGRAYHPTYGYALPGAPPRPDDSAQRQLHQLIGRIIELNVFCQRAARDDALAVALQLPALPELVDRILVGTAHFAAYFENLVLTNAHSSSDLSTIEFAPMLLNVERRRLMATDSMIMPEKVEAYVPFGPWPHVGIETLTQSVGGERFFNKVYFPQANEPPKVPLVVRTPGMADADA